VYPLTGTAGFLAGVPAFLKATAESAQYRGRLVRIAAADGRDPLPGSAEPGIDASYRLLVTNLGRNHEGQGEPDDIELRVALPEGTADQWTARFPNGEPTMVLRNVQPGVPQEVVLAVRNRTALQDRSRVDFDVVATSLKSPQGKVQDRLQVSHALASGVRLGLTFEGGFTEKEDRVQAGESVASTVVVKNLGSKWLNVTLTVGSVGSASGWRNRLTLDGEEVESGVLLQLPTGRLAGEKRLALTVTPPAEGLQGISTRQILEIKAEPREEPASFKTIFSTTEIVGTTDVRIRPLGALVYAAPGTNATFFLNVTNDGVDSATMTFQLGSDAPASWPRPTLSRWQGQWVPQAGSINVPGRGTLPLRVNVTVPEGEPAGRLVAVRLGGRQSDASACQCESILHVLVRPQHRLAFAPLPPVLAPPGGGNVTLQVALDNHGNLDEDLELVLLSLPPQWGASIPGRVLALRNGSASFPVTLSPARSAVPGLYNVTVGLVAEDGHVTPLRLRVQVGATGQVTAGELGTVQAQPGGLAVARFPLRNEGNTPLTVRVEQAPGEAWGLRER
ncbi:MAG TPA: hypothetical protein VHI93_01860, partial [Candidatus Thermoplasmatota archaeon]|nr:hypothetical protein [Candidatus Thermoplasmatota archaeon]